jgi:very-short-patch-repair endonuclease
VTPAQTLAKEQARAKREALELAMLQQLKATRLTKGLLRNYRFHATRLWLFDFAWPEQRVALEVDGGHASGGRHVRPKGFEADCEKINAAVLDGWAVLRVTSTHVRDGQALAWVNLVLQRMPPA